MNWIPKAKLWAVKAVKLGRMNINGSSGLRGANRPTEPTEFCKKECSGNSRVNFREYKESTGPVTAYITEIYQWVVKAVQVRKMMSTDSCGSTVRDTVKVKESRSTVNCVHSDMPPPALINQAYVPANLFSKGGKSDGKAGAINQAGGAFKQMGAAKENQFFYKKERELIENLRQNMKEQLEFHEEEILKHQQAIERIKRKQRDM